MEKGAGIIRIGADGGDRLVDLMGNPGGDLAEDRQPVRLDEVLLHGLELLGGLPVVGDLGFETVARHAQVARPLLDARLKRIAGQPLLGAAHGYYLATAQEQCGKREKRYERGKGEELRLPRTRCERRLQRRQLLEPPVRRRYHGFHAQEGCGGVARQQGVERGGAIGPRFDLPEGQRQQRRIAELQAFANGRQPVFGDRLRRHEAPGGQAGDEDDAAPVGDIGRLARGLPIRLDPVEFELGDDHPQRTAGPVDAPGNIKPGPIADRAHGEMFGHAVADGEPEIIAEGIVVADKARRLLPVAGRDGDAAPVDQINDRASALVARASTYG